MIEILFRGKGKYTGEWLYGGYFHDKASDKHYIMPVDNRKGDVVAMFEVIPETVGQYAGRDDKNGTKIFKGDIVEGTAYLAIRRGAIVWIDEIASFGIKYQKRSGGLRDEPTAWKKSSILTALQRWKAPNEFQAEVIGNIHDNPEMLEVTE